MRLWEAVRLPVTVRLVDTGLAVDPNLIEGELAHLPNDPNLMEGELSGASTPPPPTVCHPAAPSPLPTPLFPSAHPLEINPDSVFPCSPFPLHTPIPSRCSIAPYNPGVC